MSGLSAIVQLNGAPAQAGLLARCVAAVPHRGREIASHVAGRVALALIDRVEPATPNLVAAASDSGCSLVMAGQLYGREELAAALGGEEPTCDAALALAAYRRWGADAIDRMDGDFALVLYDGEADLVLCARDPFGVHPLCYAFDGKRLVAASEARQILATGVAAEPCEHSIAAYLSATRHLAGGPHTFYRDIRRVEPGHYVVVRSQGSTAQRYWQLDPERRIGERTDEEMTEHVRLLMTDAVRRRVPESGPYSCALSGGFDSSSVAALFRLATATGDEAPPPLETFSFELRDLEADEPEIIAAVSSDLGSHHHHIYLDRDNVFAVLPEMVAACDEPTLDMGLLYLWRKKESAAREGVRVMLSGLGGDELFVGQFHFLSDLLRSLRLKTLWEEVQGIYPVDRSKGQGTSLRKLLQFYAIGPLVPRRFKRLARRTLLGQEPVPPWIDAGLARRVALADRIEAGPERLYRDAYRQDCYEVFSYSLVGTTLPLHEALGSAFGVETRFPLIDRRLVEYMFAVPRDQKIRQGEVRLLQRRAMRGILPRVVLEQHVKKNINPVLRRQQQHNFVAEVKELLAHGELRCEQYLDRAFLRRSHERFLAGDASQQTSLVLWSAMNLERWLEGLQS